MITWNRIKNMRLFSMSWLAFSILPLTAACQVEMPEESVDTEVEAADMEAGDALVARPIQKFCGGLLGLKCDKGEYCDYTLDAMCGAADQTGVCKPIPQACTREYNPVCGCDGNTYSNPCVANSAGTSVAYYGECKPPPGEICGVRGAPECAKGEFCDFPLDSMCGAADQPGKCTPIPEICTKEYNPVCGCDGNTYSNPCMANAAGVSVASLGPCEEQPSEQACGGLLGLQCDKGEFCNYPIDAMCGAADQTGVCEPIPQACLFIYKPVCGCDGKTYSNECLANAAGVSVASLGACEKPSERACGGLLGLRCDKGEFCNYPIDAMCGAADQTGICTPIPDACTLQYDPVCGCDGRTYSNACAAHMNGVSVASEGPCRVKY